jgi:hypothetical protein
VAKLSSCLHPPNRRTWTSHPNNTQSGCAPVSYTDTQAPRIRGLRGSHTVCVFFATVIAHDLPKNDIAQFFVHAYGYRIANSHVQVDKVAVMTASPPARHEKRQTGRKQLIDTRFAVVQRTPPTTCKECVPGPQRIVQGTTHALRPHTYKCSEILSRECISCCAKPKRRNSGATVTAVTCPCQCSPLPSALPNI